MWIYCLAINVVGYFIMWLDKNRAIHRRYRISEKQLGLIALCLGALGMTLGMYQFRHKTKTWYFKYGLPLLSVVQIVILFM